MLRNPPFCSFASILIVSLTRFINKPDSARDLTTFMISSISLFEIIGAIVPEQNDLQSNDCCSKSKELPDYKIFSMESAADDATAVNLRDIKTLLADI